MPLSARTVPPMCLLPHTRIPEDLSRLPNVKSPGTGNEATSICPWCGICLGVEIECKYQYNWKTNRNMAGRCFLFILELADDATHVARFRFN